MENEMVVTDEELAFWAGYEAGENGRSDDENPHGKGKEYSAWQEGWYEGKTKWYLK